MKSSKLRKSARGQNCTFAIPGICNSNPETVVLCHLQFEGGVMGGKETDLSAAYGCSSCHEAIDQRKVGERFFTRRIDQQKINSADRWFYMGRALARTHKIMARNGIISV